MLNSNKPHHRPVMLPPESPNSAEWPCQAPLSLQELCIRKLCRSINSDNVLELMQVMGEVDMPVCCSIHTSCLRYVVQSFSTLRARRSPEELQRLMPEELYLRLEGCAQEAQKGAIHTPGDVTLLGLLSPSYESKCSGKAAGLAGRIHISMRELLAMRQKAVLGRIVEPMEPKVPVCLKLEPSVAGHAHSYVYEAVVSGVRWPADVDPARREQHLSRGEFQRVVGMSYAEFCSLATWKKSEIKKELKLF